MKYTFRKGPFVALYCMLSFILTVIAMMPISVHRALYGFPPISFEMCFILIFLLLFLGVGVLVESSMYLLRKKGVPI